MRSLLLALFAGLFVGLSCAPAWSASSRTAGKLPGWVKPMLAVEHPQGAYLHEDDRWLTLYSAVTVSEASSGGLRLDYRALFRSLSDEPAVFTKSFSFDEASETLGTPVMFSQRRGSRWVRVDAARTSLEVPANQSDFVTADRQLLLSTKPVYPGGHVVATWSVTENDAYPGERSLFGIESFPVLTHVVEVKPGADVRMLNIVPTGDNRGQAVSQSVTRVEHHQIPADSRLFTQANWQASPYDSLPHAFVTRQSLADLNWSVTGARVRALFDQALQEDQASAASNAKGASSYAAQARSLVQPQQSKAQQIAALASFAQKLNYRDVEWGLGAYLPERPSEVLRTRSGDCKAKTLLLHAMLKEIDVESVPVLARLSQNYLSAETLQRAQLPAHGGYFNHMVLAVRAPPEVGAAGQLTSGAGAGWVLFDPTDSLATFGLPPRNLSGTPGVWLAEEASVFEIELAGRANHRQIDLEITLDPEVPTERATFSAKVSGNSPYIDSVANNQLEGQVVASKHKDLQRTLRAFMPDAELSSVRFIEPDYATNAPVQVVLSGTLRLPLQKLTDELHALAAPMLLVRHTLGLSATKVKLAPRDPLSGPAAAFDAPLCCASYMADMEINIRLKLPQGWVIHKTPRLASIQKPWLEAQSSRQGNLFSATTRFLAGEFEPAGDKTALLRTKDLNRLRSFWRGKFVLRKAI